MLVGAKGRWRVGIHVIAVVFSFPVAASAQSSTAASGGDDGDSLDWLVDGNVGALRFTTSDMHVAGDATVGVGQRAWGALGWGSGSAYQLSNETRDIDTSKLEGAGEAWLSTGGSSDPFRLLLQASGGGANYASTVYDKSGTQTWTDQDSWLGRGSVLVGMLLRPSLSFSAHLAAGGGAQFEWYDTTSVAVGTASFNDTQDLSFIGRARLDVAWTLARQVVSLRGKASASYFKLDRDNEFLGASSAGVTHQNTTTSFSHIEVSTRGFVDVDAASFLGFRPTIHSGFDYVRVAGEGESLSTIVPILGVGLLHPWM